MLDEKRPSRFRTVVLAGICLFLAGAWGTKALWGQSPSEASHYKASPPVTSFDTSLWQWKSEEHWVVDQTVKDISEMMCFAAGAKPESFRISTTPDLQTPHGYKARIDGPGLAQPIEQEVVVHEWLWDPSDYQGWTRTLAVALGVKAAPSDATLSVQVPSQLLDPSEVRIEMVQKDVTKSLNREPTCADAHDAAGAVLAVFGMFDQAGVFTDHRHLLCQISAHLALSEELSSGRVPGPSGALARLGLLDLVGRTQACTLEITRMREAHPQRLSNAWLNAMYMNATRDWRGAVLPSTVSKVEMLASFAGRCEYQSVEKAMDWAGSSAELSTFVIHSAMDHEMSVGIDEELTRECMVLDQSSMIRVRAMTNPGQSLNQAGWIPALNARSGYSYDPQSHALVILDWGAWAQRFQAALLDDMMRSIDYYANHLGSKKDMDAYLDAIEKQFSGLDQFPVLQKRYANLRPSVYSAAIKRAEQLLRDHPEAISDTSFVCLGASTPGGAPPLSMPKYSQWLALPLPFGTAFNATNRCWEMQEWAKLSVDDCQKTRALDPYNSWFARTCIEKQFGNGKPTPKAVEAMYGPIRGYAPKLYLDWMIWAYPDRSPELIPLYKEEAGIDPFANFNLGDLLVDLHREPEALQAYLQGYKTENDRVAMSNSMFWAVRYLYRTGHQAKAEEIAVDCGEVYSANGLATLAILRELQGRFDEAEGIYAKSAERYGSDDAPSDFGLYARNAAHDPGMKAKFDQALVKFFPKGLVKWEVGAPNDPPILGIRLSRTPAWAQRDGLLPGAIIVAMDGYRVENTAQYLAVREINLEEQFDLTVYEQGHYQTLHLEAPFRRFGVDLQDYSSH